ncbi:MAG: DEAD/DEAH box helicase [Myxococcales bacterium]|nr:DEAD/DEAH box helicase [Myxococcales bacterium]
MLDPQADASATLAEALSSGACGSLSAWEVALAGWKLKLREQFDELLCLERLRDVRRLDYQVETVLRVLRQFRGRALLADEVGLGKTIEAGMLVSEFLLRGLARRVLVITPAALVGQWRAELSEKFSIEPRCTDEVAFRADPETAWASADGVVVASLQTVRHARHNALVQARPWDMVVVDEAHHLKNRATAAYRLVDSLKSRYLLLLTATPVENDLEELYNLVTLLKPGQLATPAQFKRDYLSRGDPFSPRNRDRLRALLSEVMVRNTRALAGKSIQLPPRFAQTVVVEPSDAEAALYRKLLDAVREFSSSDPPPLSHLAMRLLLEQAGSSAHAAADALLRLRDRAEVPPALEPVSELARAACEAPRKVRRLLDIVRALPSIAGGSKAVVFTRFHATQQMLERSLHSAGVPYSSFHGGMTGAEKDEAVDRLGRDVEVMLATEVGGEGRNLQVANVLVNYDLPWNPMRIEQRIGRVHRIGQAKEVHVYSLCGKGSAEERILDVLERRIHLFELVIGEMDLVLGRALDEKDFEERIYAIFAGSADDADVARKFDELASALSAARGHLERVKELDQTLFGRDFET